MSNLQLNSIGNIRQLANPVEHLELSLTSPALEFFTDFTEVQPLVVESSLSAVDTVKLMKKTHVRLKLVVNSEDEFVGIVSADNLLERKIVQKLDKGEARSDLPVTDFMIPRSKLKVLEYKEIENSTINKVISALENSGQQHCLVVDSNENIIRGLFSVSDISRKLKVDIDIHDQPSFSKLADRLD